jgi:hypothetical protein
LQRSLVAALHRSVEVPVCSPAFVRVLVALAVVLAARAAAGQSLNIEGQTGGIITPFAVVPSADGKAIHPTVSFHWLSLGDVLGNRYQITIGADVAGRVEFGYTKAAVATEIEDGGLNVLFDRGFQSLHGKVLIVAENATPGLPAFAVGGRFRWNREELHRDEPMRNGDLYVVATKSFQLNDTVVLLLNGGINTTKASLFAFAGNATGWTARGFGAAAVGIDDRLQIGAEFLQQPKAFEGLPEIDLPTTLTAYAQITPVPGRLVFSLAVMRLAGEVDGVDLKAGAQLVLGASVRF